MDLDRIRAWVEGSDSLHQDFLPLHRILVAPIFDVDVHQILRQMSTACLRSTGSVLVLLENGRHWDAELVLRSVQEGTIKFTYLVAEPSEMKARLHEFSDDLFEIASVKRHDRATEALDIFATAQIRASPARPAILLSQAEYDLIASRYPATLRRQIEGIRVLLDS